MSEQSTGRRPTHRACFIEEYTTKDGESKAKFIEICPIRQSEKGNLVINIPYGMALSGKIIIMEIQDRNKPTEDDDVPF